MAKWPSSYDGSWTIAETATRRGVGLHTGLINEVRLLPSSKRGFYLSWIDSEKPPVKLCLDQVRDTPLCTTLQVGTCRLATVEHLLAAVAGCGLTHIEIQVSGEEVPLLDGSARGWVEAIWEAGLKPASSVKAPPLLLERPLVLNRGSSVITATPAEKFSLVGLIDFPQEVIGRQSFVVELTPERFVQEIAPARTFGFRDQVDRLRESGLIKGGSLKNALVCDEDHWMNPPLRFPDEPVRHKLLDLIGDLAIVGFPQAQVIVYKGSHGLHSDFAVALQQSCSFSSLNS